MFDSIARLDSLVGRGFSVSCVGRSSSGPGHRPLKAEIRGSNPLRPTKLSHEKDLLEVQEVFLCTILLTERLFAADLQACCLRLAGDLLYLM